MVRTGDSQATPMLIVGCIHGDECAGIAVARALERAHVHADLWIVPDLNPDGHARDTRQDGGGVDLNANWSSQWRGGGRPWDVYYPSPAGLRGLHGRAARRQSLALAAAPSATRRSCPRRRSGRIATPGLVIGGYWELR